MQGVWFGDLGSLGVQSIMPVHSAARVLITQILGRHDVRWTHRGMREEQRTWKLGFTV